MSARTDAIERALVKLLAEWKWKGAEAIHPATLKAVNDALALPKDCPFCVEGIVTIGTEQKCPTCKGKGTTE